MLFALLLGGCSYVKQPNDKKMKKLLSGMPEYSAGEAFGKRDFRFLIVIDGEQTTQPDVPDCLVTRFGTKSLSVRIITLALGSAQRAVLILKSSNPS